MRIASFTAALAATLSLLFSAPLLAQDKGSEAEAKKMLASVVALIKAKGLSVAAEQLNKGDECKVKDMGCLVVGSDASVLVAPRTPAMVGQQFPAFTDVDGKNVTALLLDPLKQGKASWDASYKGVAPGSKAIVPRRSLCSRIDAQHAVCVTYTL